MKLNLYLDREGVKPALFAERAGISLTTVYRIISGKLWPKREVWLAIERASKGCVTPNDHLHVAADSETL